MTSSARAHSRTRALRLVLRDSVGLPRSLLPRLQRREIGLGQRPRFGHALPAVGILKRAKPVRLRSSRFRAFVCARCSLLVFSAWPAQRHLVFPQLTLHCSKLREEECESPKWRCSNSVHLVFSGLQREWHRREQDSCAKQPFMGAGAVGMAHPSACGSPRTWQMGAPATVVLGQ